MGGPRHRSPVAHAALVAFAVLGTLAMILGVLLGVLTVLSVTPY